MKKAIGDELSKSGTSAIYSLMRCFTYDMDSIDYMIQVLVTANYLERISCLVYKGADGVYRKLPTQKYKESILRVVRNSLKRFTVELRNTEFRRLKLN